MARLAPFMLILILSSSALSQPLPLPETEHEATWLFKEAKRLHADGKLERAVAIYRKALGKDPGRLEYRPYLGLALDQLERSQEAVEQYDHYLRQEPGDVTVRLNRALASYHSGQLDKSWQESEGLKLLTPENPKLHTLRGLIQLALGRPHQAISELVTALALGSDEVEPRLNLAVAYLQADNPKGAAEQIDWLLKREPQNALAGNNQAVLLAHQGELEAAETLLGELSQKHQNPDALWLNLARLLARRGQNRQAVLVVSELLDQRPQHRAGLLLYGRLLYRQGQLERAKEALEKVENPDTVAHTYLGLTHLALGELELARVSLEAAALAEPESWAAKHNLSVVLGRLGELDEAVREAQSAAARAPRQPSVVYHLAVLYDRQARPRKAIEAYQTYLELVPDDPGLEGLLEHIDELEQHSR